MKRAELAYELPPELIAQRPVTPRDASRLMVLNRAAGSITHHIFRDLPRFLRPGDCLVLNDTRVVPARFYLRRASGGRVEGLFVHLEQDDRSPAAWRVQLKPSARLRSGEELRCESDEQLRFRILARHERGAWTIQPQTAADTWELLNRIGQTPLPPYIALDTAGREGKPDRTDDESYQTIYARQPGAVAAPFDVKRLQITGPVFPVLSDLGARAGYQVRTFAVAPDGTLAYVPKSSAVELGILMWVDRHGKSEPIAEIDRVIDIPRLSHSGRSIAFRIPAPNCEIWVHDIQRGVTTRLTHESDNHGLAWSADDTHIIFARLTAPQLWGVMATSADGAGKVDELSPSGIPRGFVSSVSPDGKFVLVNSVNANGEDVYLANIAEQKVGPLLDSRYRERAAVFSRDGRYIAYVSDESGREEIYVQPFPGMNNREQISTNGGADPVWSVDGKELFFRSGQKLMAVAVTLEPRFTAGRPQLLFEANFTARGNSGLAGYDVHPDGQRFVMVGQRAGHDGANVNIVLNWFEELRSLAPEPAK